MKRVLVMLAVAAMAATVWAHCGSCPGDKPEAGKMACCKAGDTAYVCTACNTVAAKAGKCAKCGVEAKAMHVLAMKDGSVTVCPCGAECKCTLKADNPTQCTCGKTVITVKCQATCPSAGAAAK